MESRFVFVCRIETKTIFSQTFSYVQYLCFLNSNNELELAIDLKTEAEVRRIQCNDFLVLLVDQKCTDEKKAQAQRQKVWLVSDDFEKKGEFKPEKIHGVSTYFDTLLRKEDCDKVQAYKCQIKDLLGCNFEPMALYHGSGADKLDSILKHGLKSSFGMLGNAVYLGTFFKACRYASRQQNYQFRSEGVVIRCLAFAKTFANYPSFDHKCECEKCMREMSGFEKVSDHLSVWNRGQFCAVQVCVSEKPFGFKKTGEAKYLSKNAEWGFREESVQIQEYLYLDLTSVMGPEYHPLQRNCKCIWF
jgi:hypothetical protein